MDDKRDAPKGPEGRGSRVSRGTAQVVSGAEFAGIGLQFALTILVFVFAGVWLDKAEYIDLWKKLDHDPAVEEVLRNWPVRQPVLWT